MFKGYYKQDEVTRETLTDDGWLRTGDAGFFDKQGQLVDHRPRQGCRQARPTARPFAPQFIENKLKFSPFIGEAVAFGDEQAVRRGDDRDRHADRRQLGGAAAASPTPASWI